MAGDQTLANGMWQAVQPENLSVPKAKDEVPVINFTPLQNALAKLQASRHSLIKRRPRHPLGRLSRPNSTVSFIRPSGCW